MEKRTSAYHPPVLHRCVAHAFFEYAVEVLRVLEAQVVGYLGESYKPHARGFYPSLWR